MKVPEQHRDEGGSLRHLAKQIADAREREEFDRRTGMDNVRVELYADSGGEYAGPRVKRGTRG